jgi:hypothetical protein
MGDVERPQALMLQFVVLLAGGVEAADVVQVHGHARRRLRAVELDERDFGRAESDDLLLLDLEEGDALEFQVRAVGGVTRCIRGPCSAGRSGPR